jgi:hypothetical protein
MRPIPPQPSHGPTPPRPERANQIPSTWKGTRTGAVPITHENVEVSSAPTETRRRRQGHASSPGNNRAGVVRTEGEGWVYAPGDSHISRSKLVIPDDGTPLQLQVVFKGPEGVGEVAEYVYLFSDYDEGVSIWNKIRRSAHPYSLFLYPDVIQAGIPYYPLSRS